MAFKVACQLSHRVAAFATAAAAVSNLNAEACQSGRVIPWMAFHGNQDPYLTYDADAPEGWLSINETVDHWISRNRCVTADTTLLPNVDPDDNCTVQKMSYQDSDGLTTVVMHKVLDGGAGWPGGQASMTPSSWGMGRMNNDMNASQEIWNFFSQFRLSQFVDTDVNSEPGIAEDFILRQNYPNPFNPSTTIHFPYRQPFM